MYGRFLQWPLPLEARVMFEVSTSGNLHCAVHAQLRSLTHMTGAYSSSAPRLAGQASVPHWLVQNEGSARCGDTKAAQSFGSVQSSLPW
jgi:hypothetical protein